MDALELGCDGVLCLGRIDADVEVVVLAAAVANGVQGIFTGLEDGKDEGKVKTFGIDDLDTGEVLVVEVIVVAGVLLVVKVVILVLLGVAVGVKSEAPVVE